LRFSQGDQIIKWPEERQTHLVARVLHNRQGKVSSAVFGTQTSSDVNTSPTGEKLPASIASVVKSKPHKNPKARPNDAPEVTHNKSESTIRSTWIDYQTIEEQGGRE
jgi:hypothetical protein